MKGKRDKEKGERVSGIWYQVEGKRRKGKGKGTRYQVQSRRYLVNKYYLYRHEKPLCQDT